MYMIFILLFGITTVVIAQPNPDTLWTRTYGGSGYDNANSVQQTTDGGYVIAGYTESFGENVADPYVVKTDAQGDTLWTRTYGGSGWDFAQSIQQTTDGGYVVAGYTNSFGAGNNDFYVVKTNAEGDTLWTRTYGGSEEDQASSIQQTTDGGYVVAGFTRFIIDGISDCYVVKTDAQGDSLWTRTYGGTVGDVAYSIQQPADGGYVIAGTTNSFGAGNNDFYVVKTDAQGDTLWTHTYGGGGNDFAYSIQQTTDGGYVIAGTTYSFGAGEWDFYVVKTDAQGDTLWTRTYGGTDVDWAWSVQQTTDGGYVLGGNTWSFGAGGSDFYVVKTGPDVFVPQPDILVTPGELNFGSVMVGDSAALPIVIQSTGDTNLVVSAVTLPQDFHSDFALPQIIAPGQQITVMVTFAPSVEQGYDDLLWVHSNALDSLVSVQLLGSGVANAANPVQPLPREYLLAAYPNPFNPTTTISFSLPRESYVLLNVFDLNGRSVVTLADDMMQAGSHKIDFDAAALPSGIYIYRLTSGNVSQGRKLVLLK